VDHRDTVVIPYHLEDAIEESVRHPHVVGREQFERGDASVCEGRDLVENGGILPRDRTVQPVIDDRRLDQFALVLDSLGQGPLAVVGTRLARPRLPPEVNDCGDATERGGSRGGFVAVYREDVADVDVWIHDLGHHQLSRGVDDPVSRL